MPSLNARTIPNARQFERLCRPGKAIPVRVEVDADTETPVSAFLKLTRGQRQAFLFESVEGGERSGRWSFLGAGPRKVYRWRMNQLGVAGSNPLDAIQRELARHRAVHIPGTARLAGGMVGYLGYDAVRLFEPRVPLSKADELGFPDALFMDFDVVVAFDNLRRSVQIIAETRCEKGDDPAALYQQALRKIEAVFKRLQEPLSRSVHAVGSKHPEPFGRLKPRVTRSAFESAVKKAREYIRAGDCQQIVLSQRFDAAVDIAPFDLYRTLRRINPSPYLFYLQDGDQALVGSSPETLVRLEDGDVTLRPIAGTRWRGHDDAEDARLERELRADPKENAEHVMLVDLGRNDVGRVAQVGTIVIDSLKTVERYSHVMHLVSQVRGVLRPGLNAFDVLGACFPAGTVTGSPKVRAMEIIDALEPARRGPYAGSVGYFDRSGNMEMCIAIRTLLQSGRQVSVQAGAGIVYDSKPAAEYDETVNKAKALFAAVAEAQASDGSRLISAGRGRR